MEGRRNKKIYPGIRDSTFCCVFFVVFFGGGGMVEGGGREGIFLGFLPIHIITGIFFSNVPLFLFSEGRGGFFFGGNYHRIHTGI